VVRKKKGEKGANKYKKNGETPANRVIRRRSRPQSQVFLKGTKGGAREEERRITKGPPAERDVTCNKDYMGDAT